MDPTPSALILSAPKPRLAADDTIQLAATAIGQDASRRDVTPLAQGTIYTISNPSLASVSSDGLVKVNSTYVPGSSARLLATATNEGGIAASYLMVLGARGTLSGKVTRADGVSPVAGASVAVIRNQPLEALGAVVTDASGAFMMEGVAAGSFKLAVTDPATGDRGQGSAVIATEGAVAVSNIKLTGQGQLVVSVIDASGKPLPNATVALAVLGGMRDTRTALTDATGKTTFAGVAATEFNVSTRDPLNGQLASTADTLTVGAVLPVVLQLQPVGSISGTVFGADGASIQEGVQVRILAASRGIVSQAVTGADGKFSFDSLSLADGPFTLDAFSDGRLRVRQPAVLITTANEAVLQNLRFAAVGTVRGQITDANNKLFDSVTVTLQSLDGLRLTLSARAGLDGGYMIQGVPVGNYTISASTADGRAANATGNLAADGSLNINNLQLAASGIVGMVFARDGVTPVGEGVTVYLQKNPSNLQLALTLSPGSTNVVDNTRTNAQGQYSFAVTTAGNYVVQAQDGSNRGRTQIAITAITPGQPNTANLSMLGKGIVSGTVRDAAGVAQANTVVRLTSTGAFTNTWEVNTDAAGHYEFADVFIGDLTIVATHTASKLTGLAAGRMYAEGNSVALDVTLAATGTVQGRVLKLNGTAAAAPLQIDLYSGAKLLASQRVSSGNEYTFALVPVGDIRVQVAETATGDQGMTVSKLSSASEVRTLDVKLIGQGAVRVKALDSANNPVANAKLVVLSQSAFPIAITVLTDSAGMALVQPVFNGDFSVSATKVVPTGTLSGGAQGTIVNGATVEANITMNSRLTGTITGIVYGPDRVTPRRGAVVSMDAPPTFASFKTIADANGRFTFDRAEAGVAYRLRARNSDVDRIRAQVAAVQIDAQNQVLQQDMVMLGAGTVSGVVKTTDGAAVQGAALTLTKADAVYGGSFAASTESNGRYTFNDMPAGTFTMVAASASASGAMRAEAAGTIKFDGDAVTVDLTMVDSAIPMPHLIFDANAIPFDLAGDGSIVSGMNRTFEGSGAEARGMRLDILVGATPVPFLNGDGTIGRLTENKQQIEVDERNTSGLTVTRRIFVPKGGYFARYLEVLDNPTQQPITVGLRVTSNYRIGATGVVDSSNGDQVLSVLDSANRDRWVIIDDAVDGIPHGGISPPAMGHVFEGSKPGIELAEAAYELVGATGKARLEWRNVTVQPGQTISLMHFVFGQMSRDAARTAALRLSSLPPEALAGLTEADRASIANFVLPADGIGSVEPLPAIDNGAIRGKALASDGVTAIKGATVRFKSNQALFGREFSTTSDANGDFAFTANVDGSINAMPVPLAGAELSATHPNKQAQGAASFLSFPAGTTSVAKDVIFSGTGNLRGTVKRADGTIAADAALVLQRSGTGVAYDATTAGHDGTYLLTGLVPNEYALSAKKAHPQQESGCCAIEGQAIVNATADQTTLADVVLEPVGTVTGVVRDGVGVPVIGARVWLRDSLDRTARVTVTDTAGRYRFNDVKIGVTTISAVDPVNGADGKATTLVDAGMEAVADVGLRWFGTINVEVRFARGMPTPGASVTLNGITKVADASGHASFNVPVAKYTATARHPDVANDSLNGSATVTLVNAGEVAPLLITLKPAGAVRGTIVRPDGSTLAGGFPYTVKLINGAANSARAGATNGVGAYRMGGLPTGSYLVTAYDPVAKRYADGEATIQSDGDEPQLDLVLQDNALPMPTTLFDANRFRFDVQSSGALLDGTSIGGKKAFADAAILEVNGVAFGGTGIGFADAGKRQLTMSQPTLLGGVKVTRKVYVPKGGYFARYLEIFENQGAQAVVLDARVRTQYPTAQLIDSSGRVADAANEKSWVVLDDAQDGDVLLNAQQPTTSHVFGQAGAAALADAVQLTATVDAAGQFIHGWSHLTVPAGGKTVLMHFVVQQVNRAGALAAAQRLVQLPPEALEAFDAADMAAVANFQLPADGTSTVASLPALNGRVSGRAVEGDGASGVNGVRVTVQSSHPLFNRVWGLYADSGCAAPGTAINTLLSALPANVTGTEHDGAYSVQGTLSDVDSVAVPEGSQLRVVAQEGQPCFTAQRGHPWTHIASKSYMVAGAMAVEQDVQFDSGIVRGRLTGPADLVVNGGRVWRATENEEAGVLVAADGGFVFPGLPAGTYDLLALANHPQGSPLRGERVGVVVAVGATAADIPLQASGAIAGTIRTASGLPVSNSPVALFGPASSQLYNACQSCAAPAPANVGKHDISRTTYSDAQGRYSFSAVPPGSYSATTTDAATGSSKNTAMVLGAGQSLDQVLVLFAVADLRIKVVDGDNGDLPLAAATVTASAANGSAYLGGMTDANGTLTVRGVIEGNVQIGASRLLDSIAVQASKTVAVTAGNDGSTVDVVVQLKRTVGSITVTVVNKDSGNAPVANAQVMLTEAGKAQRNVGSTTANGTLFVPNVAQGSFTVAANALVNGVPVLGSATGAVTPATIGQTIPVTLAIGQVPQQIRILTFNTEAHLYSIPVRSGDVISVTIAGDQVDQTAAAYTVNASVYDLQNTVKASGYGFGPANGFQQFNSSGDLHNIVASADGNYTLKVYPYSYSNGTYLGGYRAAVSVNGVPMSALTYIAGGTVEGTVVKADGVTPAPNRTVQLSSAAPGMNVRATTAADGSYRFSGVPMGLAQLWLWDVPLTTQLGTAIGTLSVGAPVLTKNWQVPSVTTTQATVQLAASLAIPGSSTLLSLIVKDVLSPSGRTAGTVKFSGTRTSSSLSFTAYGESATVYVAYPNSTTIAATASIPPSDGGTATVVLNLASSAVSGTVFSATGSVVPSTSVTASNSNVFVTATTNASGVYQFASLPSGEIVNVSAVEATTGVTSYANVVPVSGQANPGKNITLVGKATVTGQVVDPSGNPLANTSVWINYPYNASGTTRTTSTAVTTGSGNFTILNVPTQTPLTLFATTNTKLPKTQSLVLSPIQTNGATVAAPTMVVDLNPVVRVSVIDSAGAVVAKTFNMFVVNASGTTSVGTSNPLGTADIVAVPTGPVTVALKSSSGAATSFATGTVNVSDSSVYPLALKVSKVTGTVRFADASAVATLASPTAVTAPNINATADSVNANGQYAFIGITPGTVTVTAKDIVSGLTAKATAPVEAEATVNLDVTLSASGTVAGMLTDNFGSPVAGATVYVRSSGLALDRSAFTDAQGRFQLSRIAAGDVSVSAQHPVSKLYVAGGGKLDTEGQVLTVNLAMPETIAVSGAVVAANGSTASANTNVILATVPSYGAYLNQLTVKTDAAGNYTFSAVTGGLVRVQAYDSGNVLSAIQSATVGGGAGTTINLTLGGAVPLTSSLTGTDGVKFDVACDGAMPSGANNAYSTAYQLKVGDANSVIASNFPCLAGAVRTTGGRELLVGPTGINGLVVTRRIYVPDSGGYARYVDTMVNNGANAITLPIAIVGTLRSGTATRVLVAPGSVDNRYAVTDDSVVGTRPVLGHVFGGTFAGVAPSVATFASGTGGFNYGWNVVVPAGQKISLMHFAVLRAGGNASAAQAMAEALSTMADPNMLNGMSSDDKAAVKNFLIPQ